jgi:hypothetical protein
MAREDPGPGTRIDVIAAAELDDYRGRRKIRLRLRHFTRSLSEG